MTNRDNNLTNSFNEYLNYASGNINLSDNTIKMSIYGALNERDKNESPGSLLQKMIFDYEHIGMVLTAVAKEFYKDEKKIKIRERIDVDDKKTLSPQEISVKYHISEQAIRKACKEGRLPFEKGKGKTKYLIQECDAYNYMQTAKGKSKKEIA